jgi:hypothetical protein
MEINGDYRKWFEESSGSSAATVAAMRCPRSGGRIGGRLCATRFVARAFGVSVFPFRRVVPVVPRLSIMADMTAWATLAAMATMTAMTTMTTMTEMHENVQQHEQSDEQYPADA